MALIYQLKRQSYTKSVLIKISFHTIQVKEDNGTTRKYKPRDTLGLSWCQTSSPLRHGASEMKGKLYFNKNLHTRSCNNSKSDSAKNTQFHKCKAKLDRIKRNRPQNHEIFDKSLP